MKAAAPDTVERPADTVERPAGSVRRLDAAGAGVASAGLALGVGELVAGTEARFASPVEAVARQVIDRVPLPVERFAIETFGRNDKLALVVGTVVLSLVAGAALGMVARQRPWLGGAGFLLFSAVGAYASLAPAGGSAMAPVPSVLAAVGGALCLRSLVAPHPAASVQEAGSGRQLARGAPGRTAPARRAPLSALAGRADRRTFLSVAATVAAAGAFAAAGGRALRSRFSAAASRAALSLPAPDRPLPSLPGGVEVGVDGVAPFVTPNRDFYRVDTALVVPQVRAEDWTLTVSGLVDRPMELSFDELVQRPLVEADITMTCVSNPVGGDLVGHARWLGVRARDLLEEAGVQADADQLVGRSVDGYTCGFPVSLAYDRECLVAVGMNGEPLPLDHGFPARLVTPGIYGYVGSTKWLTELELTTFAAFDQYWARRGYAAQAPVKTMARIDTPRTGQALTAGPVPVAGVAWAQGRGIAAVEVRVDDGEFEPAQLTDPVNDDSWRQWRFDWNATAGRHSLTARAVDGRGELQTERRADVVPDGASGWMSLVVLVDEP